MQRKQWLESKDQDGSFRIDRSRVKWAIWQEQHGKVIEDQVGRVLIDFGDDKRWIIKGIPGLTILEAQLGRPRRHTDNAAKQRAYRERKKGKALRKYEKASQ